MPPTPASESPKPASGLPSQKHDQKKKRKGDKRNKSKATSLPSDQLTTRDAPAKGSDREKPQAARGSENPLPVFSAPTTTRGMPSEEFANRLEWTEPKTEAVVDVQTTKKQNR